MKRGLCCVCAVLVCTALVFAGSSARTGADLKTVYKAVVPTVAPAHTNTAVTPAAAEIIARYGVSNRAPAGYVPTSTWQSPEATRAHDFTCTEFAVPEGEPVCYDGYQDTYNSGCNATPPVFTVCPGTTANFLGTTGDYVIEDGQYRDTDWYQVTTTEPTRLMLTVTGDYPALAAAYDGTAGCGSPTFLTAVIADPCKSCFIDICVPAGTYWFIVTTQEFTGVACGAQYCFQLSAEPCTVAPDMTCPADAYPDVWQLPYNWDEAWQIFVSNNQFPDYDPSKGVLLYEHFAGIGWPPAGGGIEGVRWWGVNAVYNDQGDLIECPNPGTFRVTFWEHDEKTNRPVYVPIADAPFTMDVVPTMTDTGQVYKITNDDGSIANAFTVYQYECDLGSPLSMVEGWISIQSLDKCAFWWAASPGPVTGTGGVHVAETTDGTTITREDVDGDLSYCLTSSNIGPFYGACCPTDSGICRYTTADECVGTFETFSPNQTCDQIECVAEQWACCLDDGTTPYCEIYSAANCTGMWYRFYVCAATDPGYDPAAFGGAGNIKTCTMTEYCTIACDSPSAYGRPLGGGYLYISWDHGTGDQRYVIDSFPGFTSQIRKMKWWGNSTTIWDGPDCDFVNPAPFAIRFFHTSAGGPRYASPAVTYTVNAEYQDTGYSWTDSPELGAIDCYIVNLPTVYSPGTGTQWVSIASTTTDCDFIWAPGTGTTPSQWFYDNGTCEQVGTDRHRSFCLHTNITTGACCNELTGTCTNGAAEANCQADGMVFYKGKTCAQITCTLHTGACCNHNDDSCQLTSVAACTGTGKVWLGMDSTCAECCVVLCPAGGIAEGEPACADGYVDTYNMGCFAEVPSSDAFVAINDGEVLCGKTGNFTTDGSGRRDLDFYRYELTDPCAVIEARVTGEFQPDLWLMVGQCFTDSWCGQESTYVMVYSQSTAGPCGEAMATAAVKGPAFFYIMVSCYGTDVPCQTPYTLQVTKSVAGTCTIGEDKGVTSEAVCLAIGGTWSVECGDDDQGACCDGKVCAVMQESACGGTFMGASTTCGPETCACGLKGDANCDGAVNTFDIDPFVQALTSPSVWEAARPCNYLCANDCNDDGAVNTFDIDPFVRCLTSGCQ